MPIDALLFDKDGTLFDFAATWGAFGRSTLLRLTDGDEGKAAQLGRSIGFDFAQNRYEPHSIVIAGTVGEVADSLLPYVSGYARSELVDLLNMESAKAEQVQAVPLDAFLQGLRTAGLKLGVATNDGEAPAEQHLISVGIRAHFDFVAGYDSGHGFKPGPGQLLAFASHVGIDPSCIAMVGDSRHDLEAGRAAGMVTVGVLTGVAGPDELEPVADVVLPDIGHIPAWLSSI